MKITFIINSLNSGGAERVGVSLANGLSKLGHEISIFTHKDNIKYIPDSSIKMHWLHRHKNKLIKFISFFNQFFHHFVNDRPDIVIQIMHIRSLELLSARFFTGRKFPIVISEHNSFERPASAPMGKWQSFTKWHLNKLYDCITVLTQADKKYIGNKLRNVHVMYNPLFLKPLENLCKKEKIILSAGRIDDWYYKGFDILIKSWERICRKYPEWKLKIIGDGSEKNINFLKTLANNIDNIEFSHFTTNIQQEYQKASIYCLPSRYEGWGLVVPEAMSQGCATIACDYKGRQKEVIKDNINGIICQPENEIQLTDKIELLIDNNDLRAKIALNAMRSLDQLSEFCIAKEWEKLIQETISHFKGSLKN